MADASEHTIALLEDLVTLHKAAAERQERLFAATQQHYAEARRRTEEAIALQKTAVARQRWAVKVWLGVLVFVLACVLGLLLALSRYLH